MPQAWPVAVISSCCGANCKLLRSLFSVFSFPLTVYRLQFAVFSFPLCSSSCSVFHFLFTIFCFQFKVLASLLRPSAVCGHLFGPVIVIYMYCASCRHVSPHCGWVRALFQPSELQIQLIDMNCLRWPVHPPAVPPWARIRVRVRLRIRIRNVNVLRHGRCALSPKLN